MTQLMPAREANLDCPAKVDAYLECIDLLANGYYVVKQWFRKKSFDVYLRNFKNGHRIYVRYSYRCYYISKDGVIVKLKQY